LFVIIVIDTLSEILLTVCALKHRPLLSDLLYDSDHLKKEESRRESQKVEITNKLYAEKDQQPQLRLLEFPAAERSFRPPTAAEISILAYWKLRYARSQAQELSNEFARLLNRGSSLE
jgi:hypothetical protein